LVKEPQDRFFESDRLRLHYVVYGDESKLPLLLVHGGNDHARSWDLVAARLTDRYAVYAPTFAVTATAIGKAEAPTSYRVMSLTLPASLS
jgi:hypothetical protein